MFFPVQLLLLRPPSAHIPQSAQRLEADAEGEPFARLQVIRICTANSNVKTLRTLVLIPSSCVVFLSGIDLIIEFVAEGTVESLPRLNSWCGHVCLIYSQREASF